MPKKTNQRKGQVMALTALLRTLGSGQHQEAQMLLQDKEAKAMNNSNVICRVPLPRLRLRRLQLIQTEITWWRCGAGTSSARRAYW